MCDIFETFINQSKTSWEPETFCISTYHVGNNFVGGLLMFFLIFMTSCENQEFWFGSVVFETNIINLLLKLIKISHYKKRASLCAVYLYLFSFIEKVIIHAGMLQAQSSLSSWILFVRWRLVIHGGVDENSWKQSYNC